MILLYKSGKHLLNKQGRNQVFTKAEYVDTVDEAYEELTKCFAENDIIYVVHVPELRVTPGSPGACKLYLSQTRRLAKFPPGWLIGGGNIIPDAVRDDLYFCYD